jgi:hypothetical protein
MAGFRVGHRWRFAQRAHPTLFRIAIAARRRPTWSEPPRALGSARLSRFSGIPA